jgi:hypothetical protein
VSRRIAIGLADFDVPVAWRVRRNGRKAATFMLNAKDTLAVHVVADARKDIQRVLAPRRSGVAVSGRRGERYQGRPVHGETVTLYVIPLATSDLVATCRTTRNERATCAGIVGTARIHAARLRTLPRTAYVGRVNGILRALAQDRDGLRTSMRTAATSASQAAAAGALDVKFVSAAAAVERVRERDIPPDVGAQLARSLRGVADAYGALATAARAGSAANYGTGTARVAQAERKATRAASRMRLS